MHLALKSAMSRIPYTNKVGETLSSIADSAAAYSLRALNGGDPTVARVRRSSDDAEKDFTASDVSGGALVDWVGSGNDGFVTTWYDQSGNSNDATQSTAASQPKIVDGGVYLGELDFDGVDDKLVKSSFEQGALSQPNYIFSVGFIISDLGYICDGSNSTSRNLLYKASNLFQMFAGSSAQIKTSDTNVHLFSSLFNQTNSHAYIDGVLEGSNLDVGLQSMGGITIGARYSGSTTQGSISEIIIYDSDQSANRAAIETNINNYYDIY